MGQATDWQFSLQHNIVHVNIYCMVQEKKNVHWRTNKKNQEQTNKQKIPGMDSQFNIPGTDQQIKIPVPVYMFDNESMEVVHFCIKSHLGLFMCFKLDYFSCNVK